MPNQSPYQTALRASGHQRRVYLSDLSGEVVATYTVTATPSARSAMNVAVSLASGASADVQYGMRVVVETSGGDPKGVLNVRSNGTISDTALPLREVSKGQVAIVTGDVLKVYDDFPLVDKLTDATSAFAPDAETYSDQYSDPKPLVGGGGHWAGWLIDASAVPTDGSASLNLDPDTAATLTHAWTTTGGTLSASNVASPTVDFSAAGAGKYRLKHTVTAANGKSRVQNTRYRVHDADDPPFVGTEESPLQADPVNGWSYSIRVYDPAAFTLSPLAPVVIWVDETINGTRQSFGAKVAGRSHIKCVGYLRRARTGWDASEGRYYVIYDIVSALEMLRELPGFSKVFQHANTPTSWNEQKSLTLKRAWLYLALYYTNANEAGHDLVLDDGGLMDMAYAALYIQKTDPLGQWDELAAGADCRITCDRAGRIECQQRLELIDLAGRGGVVTTLVLTKADLVSYEMEHDFKEPVETYRARGFTAGSSGNNPLFARWSASPGYGNQSQTDEKLIASSAGDFYPRTARRGAYQNRTFTDANRVKRHAPRMTVRLPGSYDCFDLYKEWVGVTITDEPRIGSTGVFRWMVERISYSWADGTGDVELTLQAETNGYDAVDDTPPAVTDNGLGDWTPPSYNWDYFPLPEVVIPPFVWENFPTDAVPAKFVAAECSNTGRIARASSWVPTTGETLWEAVGNGLTGTITCVRGDPYNYARRWVTTTTGLWKSDNFWTANPLDVSWTQVATNAQMFGDSSRYPHYFLMSINREGYLLCKSGLNAYSVSFDTGATWTQSYHHAGDYFPTAQYATSGAAYDTQWGNAAIDHYNNGVVYGGAARWNASFGAVPKGHVIFRSLDWGLTWTQVLAFHTSVGYTVAPVVDVPYTRPGGVANDYSDGAQVVYAQCGANLGDGISRYFRSSNGGASWATLASDNGQGGAPKNFGHHSYTLDGNYITRWDYASKYTQDAWASSLDIVGEQLYDMNQLAGMNGWPADPNIMLWFGASGLQFIRLDNSVSPLNMLALHWPWANTAVIYADMDLSDYIPSAE